MSFLSCGEGRVGHGDCHSACPRNCDKPRLIEALKSRRIRDIACGSSHSAALTSSGELYTWGLGEYGRLGHGDNATQLKPKMVITRAHGARGQGAAPGSREAGPRRGGACGPCASSPFGLEKTPALPGARA